MSAFITGVNVGRPPVQAKRETWDSTREWLNPGNGIETRSTRPWRGAVFRALAVNPAARKGPGSSATSPARNALDARRVQWHPGRVSLPNFSFPVELPAVKANMARKPRVEYEGAIYHLLNRGDRKESIFRDDSDRRLFLETLGQACGKTYWQVHADCLMNNHFHLVVETSEANLVSGMKSRNDCVARRR